MRKYISILLTGLLVALSCTKVPPTPEGGEENGGIESKEDYFKYGVAEIEITTANGAKIDSKDYFVDCEISIDGKEAFDNYSGKGKIRGRGNSTWHWYPKKPYLLKLEISSEILGMDSNKDWCLMADYRDVTHMMNNVAFSMAEFLGIPHTNHARYANLIVNGEFMGLYMITERIEEGGNRVKLDAESGRLVALDINDGPGDVPDASNNYYSSVYGMASAVKFPKDATTITRDVVKSEFENLETAIKEQDWEWINDELDVESMIKYIIVQELTANVEMDNGNSTRSVFIHKPSASDKWYMGPVWDFDGGFSYNWGDIYDSRGWGHTYFEHNRSIIIFGTDPYRGTGAYGAGVPGFYSDLFGVREFVKLFKDIWNENKDGLIEYVFENIENTEAAITDDAAVDLSLWKINNYKFTEEVDKLRNWLRARFDIVDDVINNYPIPRQ